MKTRPTILVRPLKKIIRDPKTFAILSHDEPTRVPDNSHWNRCVRFGDVEKVEETKPKQSKPKRVSTREDKE